MVVLKQGARLHVYSAAQLTSAMRWHTGCLLRLGQYYSVDTLVIGTSQVEFDPDVVGVRTLLRLVDQDLGYPARLEADVDDGGIRDPSEADRRFWLCRFCWGALLAVPTFFLAMVGALTGST